MIRTTPNAIATLLGTAHGEGESFIVEATNVRRVREEKYVKAQLNDGNTTIKAIFNINRPHLDLSQVGTPFGEKPTYLIAITKHVTHNFEGSKILQILNFIPLQPPPKRPTETEERQGGQEGQIGQIERSVTDREERTVAIAKQVPRPAPPERVLTISESQLKEYQRIADLETDLQGWQIVVRVLNVSYKEFNSRTGKLTKICTLRLVDRTGMKIDAVMFGEEGRELQGQVREDEIFRISRGQVKENDYNQHRDDFTSRLTIVLTRNSELVRVHDIPCIPRACQDILTLPEVIKDMNFNRQYDLLAAVLQIGEEQTYEKEGRAIFKRSISVGDPRQRKSIEVILWGRSIDPTPELLGQTVLLKNFRLNNYRESLSLTSTFKSEIVPKATNKFHGTDPPLTICYESISSSQKQQPRDCSQNPIQKYIRDLENEINYLRGGESLTSELQFWVSFINFKSKWNYDACNNPRCKKQTDPHARCPHCGTFNQALPKKFILAIEITDLTGSLWITAFDDFAGEIFRGAKIEGLAKLTEGQLKEEGEKRLFQQFKGKVATKRCEDGNVRHTFIGKPTELTLERAMTANLEKINKAIFQ